MTAIFTDQEVAYDGSAAIQLGTGDVKIDYECTVPTGGQLALLTKNASAATEFKVLNIFNTSSHVLFKADGVQYYFTWFPRKAGASATLDVS